MNFKTGDICKIIFFNRTGKVEIIRVLPTGEHLFYFLEDLDGMHKKDSTGWAYSSVLMPYYELKLLPDYLKQ